MSLIPIAVERTFSSILDRAANTLSVLHIHPNVISVMGFVPNLIAAILLARADFVLGGIFILFGGILDMLDGKVARLTKQTSIFGAVFDAMIDRIGELAIYTGIGTYFILRNMHLTTLIVVCAVGGSMLISYVRARSESYGIPCGVGLLRRGERVLLLGFGALLEEFSSLFHDGIQGLLGIIGYERLYAYPPMPLTLSLIAIAILSPVTIVQRLIYIYKQEKNRR
jgi:CDP-diacylglycerol--glycerol-3-phosphate 3-phosphatidyltransferase